MTSRFLVSYLMVGVLAACGGDVGATDAAIPDADVSPDAPIVPVRGPVTMTVYDAGGGLAVGASVLFFDPDGTLVADADTNASGVATAEILPGGSVIYVDPAPVAVPPTTLGDVFAHLGVQPGAELVFGAPLVTPVDLAITVTAPSLGGATSYQVLLGCGTTSSSGAGPTFPVTGRNCGATTAAYVVARDAGNVALATIYIPDLAVSAAMTITGSYVTTINATLDVVGIGPTVAAVSVGSALTGPGLQILSVAQINAGGAPSGDGTFSATGKLPNLPDLQQLLVVNENRAGFGARSNYASAAFANPNELDVRTNETPWLTSAAVDIKARRVFWTELGAGSARISFAQIKGTRANDNFVTWYVMAPHDGSSFVLPELPAAYDVDLALLDELVVPVIYLMNFDDAKAATVSASITSILAGGAAVLFPAAGGFTSISIATP